MPLISVAFAISLMIMIIVFSLFYNYRIGKFKIKKELNKAKDDFHQIQYIKIADYLKKIQKIAHHNRQYQVGYNVWNYEYNQTILKDQNIIKNELDTITSFLKIKTEDELKTILKSVVFKIQNLKIDSEKLIRKISDFVALEDINRAQIATLKRLFRDTVEIFESKRSLSINSASFIDLQITKIENIFIAFDDVIDKADFNKAEKLIDDVTKNLNIFIKQINIASKISNFTTKEIPEQIQKTKTLTKSAKQQGARIDDKKILSQLSKIEESNVAIKLHSKMSDFLNCKKMIEDNLSKINSINQSLNQEMHACNVFEEKFKILISQLHNFYAITNALNPQIALVKQKLELSSSEKAKIIAYKDKLAEVSSLETKIKELYEKEADYTFKELLIAVGKCTVKVLQTLTLVKWVYKILDEKENDEIRAWREIRSLGLKLSEIHSDMYANAFVRDDANFKSLIKDLNKRIKKINSMFKILPKNIDKILDNITTTANIMEKFADNVYTTIERFKIAEKQIMWMSRYRFENKADDLDKLLVEAEIYYKSKNLAGLEQVLSIAEKTKIIKENSGK